MARMSLAANLGLLPLLRTDDVVRQIIDELASRVIHVDGSVGGLEFSISVTVCSPGDETGNREERSI
jgi:hypothetical protein